MIYNLAFFYIYIKKTLSLPWSLFSAKAEQLPLCRNIISIKSKSNDYGYFFTANGYDNCSVPYYETENPRMLEEQLYRCCANVLLTKGVLHLHSSFVLYQDRGLIFTGPSGIGKTTQAELWRDFQGATIVNGDAALLRKLDGRWTAFGTPVHGSSPYCENRQAPITAIVTLEQGKENVLTRMDTFSALSFCLPEFYRPKMDPETEDTFWNSVDSLFREVPVYHLACRPDREATELVRKELFDE